MADKETFQYTYSAPEQSEVKKIREKYLPKEMTKLDQLRALDASVTKRGNVVSIVHGILFTLLLGLGMSCCMVWAGSWFLPGIVIGCVGLAGVAATYPIYSHIVKQDKAKLAPEILRLTEELIVGEN
ncbi:MAG: hypothetical protein UEP57_06990 [Oscillospiraceae bacterium]|nr:hypothetical protein [Oscillospiraceae bacterium]